MTGMKWLLSVTVLLSCTGLVYCSDPGGGISTTDHYPTCEVSELVSEVNDTCALDDEEHMDHNHQCPARYIQLWLCFFRGNGTSIPDGYCIWFAVPPQLFIHNRHSVKIHIAFTNDMDMDLNLNRIYLLAIWLGGMILVSIALIFPLITLEGQRTILDKDVIQHFKTALKPAGQIAKLCLPRHAVDAVIQYVTWNQPGPQERPAENELIDPDRFREERNRVQGPQNVVHNQERDQNDIDQEDPQQQERRNDNTLPCGCPSDELRRSVTVIDDDAISENLYNVPEPLPYSIG